MRYVPNLIPDSSKVLPDYFKGSIYKATKKNLLRDTIFWVIGIFSLIGALVSINHPVMTFVFGLMGLFLIPPTHQFIERKLKFRLTQKIQAIVVSLLFVASLPLTSHYADIDQKVIYQQKLLDEKAAREKAISEQQEQQRKDSLTFYIKRGNQLAKEHKLNDASRQLQHAMTFASLPADKQQIENEKIGIATIKIFDLVKVGKYQAALPEINDLLNIDHSNSQLIYYRAICYSKTGKIQEAVNELNPLIEAGNTDAKKLNDKINPIRTRVAYYVTRCWDGSTSSATGRGACSHHGGVKNWNEPVYEEYRKYE